MGADQDTVDVIVRHVEGYSLSLTAVRSSEEHLLLLGTLINPEPLMRVETRISMTLDPELLEGRHIERVSQLAVTWEDGESLLQWRVETHDLGDGYRLHDARVSGDAGEMRAFGVEDLAALIGAGIFGAVGAVVFWRSHRRDKTARADVDRKWQDCLDRGGNPTAVYEISDRVGIDTNQAGITGRHKITVRCEQPAR